MKKIYGLLFLVIGCCACQTTATLSAEDIKNLSNEFAIAHTNRLNYLEEGDIASAVDCYADSAYLFDIGVTVMGKHAIKKHLDKVLASMKLKHTKNVQKEVEISGNLAYDYGTTSMELHYEITQTVERVKSKYIAIWKKQENGDWKIIKLIFNQDG